MGNIYFYSPVECYGRWDFRLPDSTGIGGSETSHIECVRILANRGYKIISYAPLLDNCPQFNNCIEWKDYKEADFTQDGIWIIYRSPESVDKFEQKKMGQKIWLVCQDVDYQYQWTQERIEKIDKVFALCDEHAKYLAARTPALKDKIYLWSNGIRLDLIRKVEAENKIERNPKRLIYTSSPDRGLLTLLKIFKRAQKQVKDLELYIYYGFKGIDLAIERGHNGLKKMKADILKETNSPNIFFCDKINQVDLTKEWLKSGIWCYPTEFSETSCITCMEAQSLGAIPITNPFWALRDNVKYGVFIPGKVYTDELIQARYVEAIVRVANSVEKQELIRKSMMFWTRNILNWERIVDILEAHILAEKEINCMLPQAQYIFQHRHAGGKILNIGASNDISGFKERGATNIDISDEESEYSGFINRTDIIADARNLPDNLYKKFDTVILGDILEHMIDEDIIKSLKEAKKCLINSGKIIITVPNDHRDIKEQNVICGKKEMKKNDIYIDGVYAYHWRPISKDLICKLINKAELEVNRIEEIEYGFCKGWGIICQ